jgi:hypothetical protein
MKTTWFQDATIYLASKDQIGHLHRNNCTLEVMCVEKYPSYLLQMDSRKRILKSILDSTHPFFSRKAIQLRFNSNLLVDKLLIFNETRRNKEITEWHKKGVQGGKEGDRFR